jgi:iron complex transport system substrate-binding protein
MVGHRIRSLMSRELLVHLPGTRAFRFPVVRSFLGLIAAAGLAASPSAQQSTATANYIRGCVKQFDARADYFPDKAVIEDAVNFSVEYRRTYKVLSVKEPYPGGPAERYVLVQCGTPKPPLDGELAGAQVINVPVVSLFAFSTTHVPLLVDLGRTDVLTGVADLDLVNNAEVEARIKSGKIVEFAKVDLMIDAERVVTARPSLLMAGSTSAPALGVIRSAGIPVVANSEWLEPTALARAEWLKYMALFLNEERQARGLYQVVKARYREVRDQASRQPDSSRPLVMTGRSTRGAFVIAGGRSYVASLIKDAGARYVWADNTATGAPIVDLESQIRRAANADVWINGSGWRNRAAMLEDEPRYAEFKAFQTGQVWVYERRLRPGGGNDYWSRSVSHPDLVLADLVKIFHPSLMTNHAFEWYLQVPAR